MRREFFLVFVLVLVILTVAGCRTVSDHVDAYQACLANGTCAAAMQENGIIAANVVHTVKGSSYNGILETIAFNLASVLTGLILGRKLKRC